jgi:alkanesulfonate monooxygenase
MALRFHWSLSSVGERLRGASARAEMSALPELGLLARFCRHAEECGIESLLVAIGFHRPDPIALATALGVLTTKIKFMVAVRSGLLQPTLFVQQVNTVAALTGGRVCINVVAGHTPEEQGYYGDFLDHDERYARTDEFLAVCRALWRREGEVDFTGRHFRVEKARLNLGFQAPDRSVPEIYLGGSSEAAERLAARHADCLWRLPDAPGRIAGGARRLIEGGTEVGLFLSLLVRPTREQAVADARALLASLGDRPRRSHEEFARRSDSVAFRSSYELAEGLGSEWLTPTLWTGAVPYLGSIAMSLVGSPEDVADALLEYHAAGVSQFLLAGWPDFEEMTIFGRDVLPLVRARERAAGRAIAQGGAA